MSNEAFGYKKLNVWEKADEMAYQIYIAAKAFPKDEVFGLTSQLRRAALSVPTNIVEGYGRQSKNELRQFVNIALGSLSETKYLLSFSARLGYLKAEQNDQLSDLTEEVGRLLWKFYKSL
ncbi:MAG: four helix bundle protein [Sedimentisphaerales bacterium]|nr:four helix bundle protein [Sedimentisphaerales bacterium]